MTSIGEHRLRISDPKLRKLYAYWEDACGGRPMPSREDIDPIEMQFILGYIALIDVFTEPLRFRVRLQGTELAQWIGTDLTGRMLDDSTATLATACQYLRAATESGGPFCVSEDRILDDRRRNFEVVVLPLSVGGSPAAQLLVAVRCRR